LSSPSPAQYLIRLLQEEAAQAQAEVRSIRNSLRYRAGSLLVEAFPPSRRSFSVVRALLRLFVEQARRGRTKGVGIATAMVPEAALAADFLMLIPSSGTADPSLNGAWVTTDAALLAAVMDAVQVPGTVLLQQLDQVVLRRLGRWQALGGRVNWQPLPGEVYSPALLGYLQSLLDSPIEPCA